MPRLLHLVGQGQGTDPPARRKGRPSPALSLTDEEARAVRAAARNIARTRFGSPRTTALRQKSLRVCVWLRCFCSTGAAEYGCDLSGSCGAH